MSGRKPNQHTTSSRAMTKREKRTREKPNKITLGAIEELRNGHGHKLEGSIGELIDSLKKR